MLAIHDFATWEPLLRSLAVDQTGGLPASGCHLAGRMGSYEASLPTSVSRPLYFLFEGRQERSDAMERVRSALADIGNISVPFAAEIDPSGQTVLRLFTPGPAVGDCFGPRDGTIILVEGAVPEPWRRLPDPTPGAVPAPSADPALVERTLRALLPDAIGATEAEIAAAEARLGITLPAELKAVYRVTREGDEDTLRRTFHAFGCEFLPLDELHIADALSRPRPWQQAAMTAVITPPDAAVQGLVGSPGWLAFGDSGGGDRIALDLTPGPRGHTGQVIMLSHEEEIGAYLLADSLTDLVTARRRDDQPFYQRDRPPVVVWVGGQDPVGVQAAAHPELEVLWIQSRKDEPLSLAPVIGLPRLRSLSAEPGTLADPREIAVLTGLEFLALGSEEWRVLLDAGAVPRSLSAAAIETRGNGNLLQVVAVANELLALWDRPLITETVVEGRLAL
ncbi:SMI1/KNR4 family protein [Actinomadura macrotermitis]|uniref:Knr4/Smi1-like domain-containing protein n=1 Tax=Actinomadura macrotermitis TaxID=2585200 RepID=A0A7K0C2D6_9ACTN|nr:SMI1/KNR4 family protein [Actinomadura macrotermitis]MQY07292.1 hypothetical protein [Actinomadura macrotermitis]